MKTLTQKLSLAFGLFIVLITIGFGLRAVLAQPELVPAEQASVLHPTFALLDADGNNVVTAEAGRAFPAAADERQGHAVAYFEI